MKKVITRIWTEAAILQSIIDKYRNMEVADKDKWFINKKIEELTKDKQTLIDAIKILSEAERD